MSVHELALQRNKYRHLSDDEWRWMLQQVEGRERTADKLPSFAAIEDWWYPVRLSCEQCSSEQTARYKAQLVNGKCPNGKCLDLTGGYGVDTYFLSEHFAHTDYVEQNEELCRIAAHNFGINRTANGGGQQPSVRVHHSQAETFLQRAGVYDLIFLDPARRDSHGGKVFRLQDCTPDAVALLPALLSHLTPGGRLLLKLSPMLDLTQAVRELSVVPPVSSLAPTAWDIHVVAVRNEVKEVLLLGTPQPCAGHRPTVTAIDLTEPDNAFVFTREEEAACRLTSQPDGPFIFEPNAAILKAGAYKLAGERYGLHKLDTNTHLYCSDTCRPAFPGRTWRVVRTVRDRKDLPGGLTRANVLCRNYPLSPEELKKKLHLRDGGTTFVIACRVSGKPTVFLAERL